MSLSSSVGGGSSQATHGASLCCRGGIGGGVTLLHGPPEPFCSAFFDGSFVGFCVDACCGGALDAGDEQADRKAGDGNKVDPEVASTF